jgi:hypothetical protein
MLPMFFPRIDQTAMSPNISVIAPDHPPATGNAEIIDNEAVIRKAHPDPW